MNWPRLLQLELKNFLTGRAVMAGCWWFFWLGCTPSNTVAASFRPTINTQLAFNQIEQTELTNYFAYLGSVRNFYAQIRQYFYLRMMRNDVSPIKWEQLP